MNPILLYHANCPDGFGSAFAFYTKFGKNMEYVPVSFGEPAPDISGRDVYIADFSYHKDELLEIKSKAKSLIVLDHHLTAQNELNGLDFCHFDMTHSGSILSWQFLYPNIKAPLLLQLIEDRDLWKWKIKDSDILLSAIDSYDRTFDNWAELEVRLEADVGLQDLKNEGAAILRYKDRMINMIIENNSYKAIMDGVEILAVNSSILQSEIGSALSEKAPFAAVYHFNGEKYLFSLRSDGVESVANIAQAHGGGGHKAASGFSTKDINQVLRNVNDK